MTHPVLLFAAGFGTRMGDLTKDRPKPLIPVAGKPLLDHALALTEGLAPRVVNAHYEAGQIAAHLDGSGVQVSHEQPEILDTGGGLRQALPLLGNNPVFTLNTDAVWRGPNPLQALRAAWEPARMDALLLCVPLPRAIGRQGGGDFHQTPDGQLRRGGDLVYTGAQLLRTDRLSEIPDRAFSLNKLWNLMAEAGRLHGLVWDGTWCDVGHPGGIAQAEEMLADV